jgi:hypothetical protein
MLFSAGLLSAPTQAQPELSKPEEVACWDKYTQQRTVPSRFPAQDVSFANLLDGDTVDSPFLVDFSIKGMGVVPAGRKMPNTGHHHVLIDTALPLDPGAEIPFSETHKHFGKGQTNAVLKLSPGRHTLRLLFADENHRPHYVFSREINIRVRGERGTVPAPQIVKDNFSETCEAWYRDLRTKPRPQGERLIFLNVRDGETVRSPFKLMFGVDGRFIAAKAAKVPNTGSLLLEVVHSGSGNGARVDMRTGLTQAELELQPGKYKVTLRYLDNLSGEDALPAKTIDLLVQR